MTLALEQTARDLFNHELEQRREAHANRDRFSLTLQASPVSWLLPRLLRLVLNNADKPLHEFEPMIRSMLRDQFFATTGGDCIDQDQLEASMDETVTILMHTLAAVRHEAGLQPAGALPSD